MIGSKFQPTRTKKVCATCKRPKVRTYFAVIGFGLDFTRSDVCLDCERLEPVETRRVRRYYARTRR